MESILCIYGAGIVPGILDMLADHWSGCIPVFHHNLEMEAVLPAQFELGH